MSLVMRRAAKPYLPVARWLLVVLLVAVPGLDATRAQADELTYDLQIEEGQVPADMRLIRVEQGDSVRLRWTADQVALLHLHGYDIELQVVPGETAEMSFVAEATGRFPVSMHEPAQSGGHSHGPALIHVEVYPR